MDTTKLKAVHSRNKDLESAGPVNLKTHDGKLIASCFNPDNGRDNAADAAELVRRWNAHPELVAALQDLTNTANHIEAIMDGDKDKQKTWTVELHGIYGAIDRARTLLQSLQSNG